MFYLLILLFSYLMSKSGTYITIKLADMYQIEEPTNGRKIHSEKVSALGGIPIFITFSILTLISIKSISQISPILLAAAPLLIIGIWDDLRKIGIKKRLLVQILAATIAFFSGFHFNLGSTTLLQVVNYGLTVLFVLIMINGVNFMDGINGLAGSLGTLGMLFFALFFYGQELTDMALLALVYGGALLGFLWYNYGKKAAIFMGDNGSTVLGFILAIFALKGGNLTVSNAPNFPLLLMMFTIIALPLLDLFAVVFIRIAQGNSPFKADRMHIHHLLTDGNKTHPTACQLLLCWSIGLITLFYFQIITTLLGGIILIIGSYIAIRIKYTKSKSPVTSPSKWDTTVPQPSPIA